LEIAGNGYNFKRLKEFVEANSLDISHFVKKLSREEYEANPKTCLNCGKVIT
jgi:phosphoribosyl-dephospho-CoA transferase